MLVLVGLRCGDRDQRSTRRRFGLVIARDQRSSPLKDSEIVNSYIMTKSERDREGDPPSDSSRRKKAKKYGSHKWQIRITVTSVVRVRRRRSTDYFKKVMGYSSMNTVA